MNFDATTIAAFVDDELDDLTARRIERAAETDATLAAEIARYRALRARLAEHYGPVCDEPVPGRLRALLVDESKVDTSLADRREARRARFGAMQWGAIAASLVLGLTIGLRPWTPAAEVLIDNGALVAAGSLANALDTQLASNQAPDAAVRIGISFEDKAGRYCRSFESRALAGIGCRQGDHWRLERTLSGGAASDYRQASSDELGAAAAAMMVQEVLDAEDERRARDAGWVRR